MAVQSSRVWGPGSGTDDGRPSLAAAHAGLQAVLIAGSALEGFEGVREAVAEHGHLAAMAHGARDEGEAPTGLARLGELDPLETQSQTWFLAVDEPRIFTPPHRKQLLSFFCPKGQICEHAESQNIKKAELDQMMKTQLSSYLLFKSRV